MGKACKVYLIGSGPGDPGLCTIRARECIERSDVVIYDYLVNEKLLRYAKPSAELIFVGKKGFSQHVTQDDIHKILLVKARQKGVSRVARLKGGDPFVFGRGGEEALILTEHEIPFEVIPGVTAGAAAAAYAGIPITHRGIASSVAFVTGHEDPSKEGSAIDWGGLAKGVDTLCFYMGVRSLPLICERLMAVGKAKETPVALVRWGTCPEQKTLVSTLGEVEEEVRRQQFTAPAIIIVGEVVHLRRQIAWFEKDRCLSGRKVIVTRSRTQASKLSDALSKQGAEVIEFPTIEIEGLPDYRKLDLALAHLDIYQWIVFTSVNGVEAVFERLREKGRDARVFGSSKVAAIGPATEQALRSKGIIPDVVPSEYIAESLVEELFAAGIAKGDKVLVPRAKVARDLLPDTLRKHGIQVDVEPAYVTTLPSTEKVNEVIDMIEQGTIDAITFTSSSTVENFVSLLRSVLGDTDIAALLKEVSLVSIGPITSHTARECGLVISHEASQYTIEGLVESLKELGPLN